MNMSHRVPARAWVVFCLGLVGALATSALASAQAPCFDSGLERLLPGRSHTISATSADPPQQYVIPVPAGLTTLTVETGGGVAAGGGADLLLRLGSQPSPSSPQHHSAGPTNREQIKIDSPQRGCWFVAVRTSGSYGNVLLRTRFEVEERRVLPARPERDLFDDRVGEYRFFSVDVPEGTDALTVKTVGGSGDADLFVQFEEPPTEEAFGVKSINAGSSDEEVAIANPQGGPYKMAMFSATPYSGVTLEVELVDDDCVPSETDLCLLTRRFRVRVDFVNQHAGNETGNGAAVPDTEQTGSFWFFDPNLSELTVKLLDARTPEGVGCFWFFWAALTDVKYTITVTDTATLAQRAFTNAPGSPSSGFDTRMFCQ
jgi:hypothetical protein